MGMMKTWMMLPPKKMLKLLFNSHILVIFVENPNWVGCTSFFFFWFGDGLI